LAFLPCIGDKIFITKGVANRGVKVAGVRPELDMINFNLGGIAGHKFSKANWINCFFTKESGKQDLDTATYIVAREHVVSKGIEVFSRTPSKQDALDYRDVLNKNQGSVFKVYQEIKR